MNRSITHLLVVGLLAANAGSSAAQQAPRQLGPFHLGMTAAQMNAAARKAGFQTLRRQVPQERDLMGLGLMDVQPATAESSGEKPEPGKIWQATAYLLSGRVAYLDIDYGTEDPGRAERWYEQYNAPANVRKQVIDTTWSYGGVVLHADRFGQSLHAVDWQALHSSNRVLVNLEGAVTVANAFFRRLQALQAETSLDLVRRRIIEHFQRPAKDGSGPACKPPPQVELTPGESLCALPEKRFPPTGEKWNESTWGLLGVGPRDVSRYYAYRIESSGEGSSTRVVVLATGDLDCDGHVATLRVRLRADPTRGQGDCQLDDGEWDLIDPLE